jgi:hypothetical protein
MTTTYKKHSQESGASLEQSESTKKIYDQMKRDQSMSNKTIQ